MSVDINKFIEESIAAGRGWTDEERQDYLDSIGDCAIFAESPDEIDPDDIAAFNSMIYDGFSTEELMENFRDKGNQHFQTGKRNRIFFRDAIVMYGKALGEAQKLDDRDSDERRVERSKLWGNIAAANLQLKNNRSAAEAADHALDLWAGNLKALYRKAKACVELRRFQDAMAAAQRGLGIDADSKELKKLIRVAQKRFGEERKRQEAKAALALKRQQPVSELWDICRTAGAQLGPPDRSMAERAGNHALGSARPARTEEGVAWPLLFLYPEYAQSDLIQAASGGDMLAEWVAQVLPEAGEGRVEWDERGDYVGSKMQLFVKLNAQHPLRNEDEALEAWGVSQGASGAVRLAQPAEEEQAWQPVHPGCVVEQLVRHDRMVLCGGIIMITLVPRGTDAHAKFLRDAQEYTSGLVAPLEPAMMAPPG